MSRIGNYWFKCPSCQHTQMEEVTVGVTVTSQIGDVGHFGDLMYTGFQTNDNGDIDHYQCATCGGHILDDHGNEIIDEEGLLEVVYYNKTKFSEEVT